MNIARLFAVPFVITALLSAPTVSAQEETSQEMRDLRSKMSELSEQGNFGEMIKLAEEAFTAEIQSDRFWEEIRSCGFYPQETRLACVIRINQPTDYGGPVGAFGSFEHVKFCIDWDGSGVFEPLLESVGSGIVHMHDEVSAVPPPWFYVVYRDIDPPGGPRTSLAGAATNTVTPAPSLRARAILSWNVAPTDCAFTPVFGNVVNFKIRLDPIR